MFILKNAYISIIRNKGRNILVGIIILVIACACTITLAINNTASDLINSYESAYDKEITISFNRENMMKDFDFSNRDSMADANSKLANISAYTVDDVNNFGTSNHIESYYYTYSISLNGNNIEKATSENTNFTFGKGNKNSFEGSLDFTMSGYSSIDAMSEFMEGTYEITEINEDAWDIAFNGNYVFINEELASYNNLSLNDTIILQDENNNTYNFIIIGIFKENEDDSTMPTSMFSNSVNTLITNASVLVTIDETNDSIQGMISPTFIIDDYENAEIVQAEFYEKGLDENYVIKTNEDVANSGLTSIQNVKSFAKTFLIITLLIGGIVLFIINMINIRERKYEIGVLRTIGVSKFKLTMQFVFELLIVACLALLLGAGIGAMMSKGVSNSLLTSEIENTQESTDKMKNNFGGEKPTENFVKRGIPNVQAYDSIDAVVNIKVIVELLVIGLTLVLISSLAAMISIQRFSPLTILKERS